MTRGLPQTPQSKEALSLPAAQPPNPATLFLRTLGTAITLTDPRSKRGITSFAMWALSGTLFPHCSSAGGT